MYEVMTDCLKLCCITKACVLIFISHAVVGSQKVDKTENTEHGNDTEPRHTYRSTLFSSAQDSIIQSYDKKEHRNALPSHLKNFVFQHFRRKGMSGSSDKISRTNYFSSIDFIHDQYYKLNEDKNFISKQPKTNAGVNFWKRKLLSTFHRNKTIKQPSKYRNRKKRKRRNETSIQHKKTGMQSKDISDTVAVNSSTNVSNSSKVNLEKLALEELEEYEEFVTLMEQTFSKDPLRAMLSLAFLMIVMMLTIKLCGMKPTTRHQEVRADFQEEVHYTSIHDILKRKRRYLPKYLLSWERRLRRKFKRRQKIKKATEQEVAPVSDNSEEETLIYSGNYDF